MMAALVPGFDPVEVELADVEVGVAWLEHADPKVRERVERAAALFPRTRSLELPLAHKIDAAFMGEVADVHRELFLEHAESYGENVRTKVERCLALSDAEYESSAAERERYRERFQQAAAGVDLVLTPTLVCVAPPAPTDELAIRSRLTSLTLPSTPPAGRRSRCPAEPPRTGCPPPSSWPPRRARTPESWPRRPRSSGRCHPADVTRTSDCARRAGADNFC
jgi:hypothetical protein